MVENFEVFQKNGQASDAIFGEKNLYTCNQSS